MDSPNAEIQEYALNVYAIYNEQFGDYDDELAFSKEELAEV